MTVTSIRDAWAEANKIFPTDYEHDTSRSERVGYPIYYSSAADVSAWISDPDVPELVGAETPEESPKRKRAARKKTGKAADDPAPASGDTMEGSEDLPTPEDAPLPQPDVLEPERTRPTAPRARPTPSMSRTGRPARWSGGGFTAPQ